MRQIYGPWVERERARARTKRAQHLASFTPWKIRKYGR